MRLLPFSKGIPSLRGLLRRSVRLDRRGASAAEFALVAIPATLMMYGAMEASLTPLIEAIEGQFTGIKVFSLPSVDHPQWGRCIELGVKGDASQLTPAYDALKQGVIQFGASLSTELVR